MGDELQSYLANLAPKRDSFFHEMEEYAREHKVPIMELDGIELLLQLIRIQEPRRILEIGTAIGYSALRMAEACPGAEIITIERDQQRYELAKQYIKRAKKEEQIRLIAGDALDLSRTIAQYGQIDLLFIDAAKGQYSKFFNLYEPLLSKNGLIISDNVLFKGYVYNGAELSKGHKGLVRKLQSFTKQICEDNNYDTVVLPVGDGVAISRKRGEVK